VPPFFYDCATYARIAFSRIFPIITFLSHNPAFPAFPALSADPR